MNVILMRHGQTEWNTLHKYQGHTDITLNDFGREQARRVASFLRENERVEAIYCSDLSRGRETAEIIARELQLPVKTDIRWREISFGHWEGLTFNEVYEQYPKEFDDWYKNTLHLKVPGGESFAELLERALPALAEMAVQHSGTVLVVSDGGLIKTMLNHLHSGNGLWDTYLDPGSMSYLEWQGDTFVPVKIGFNLEIDGEQQSGDMSIE